MQMFNTSVLYVPIVKALVPAAFCQKIGIKRLYAINVSTVCIQIIRNAQHMGLYVRKSDSFACEQQRLDQLALTRILISVFKLVVCLLRSTISKHASCKNLIF